MKSAAIFGVVYDKHTLAIRRIIVPDNNIEVLDGRHLGPGEAMATGLISQGTSLNAAFEAVTRKTGRTPPSMRDVHMADQIAMAMNGGKLVVR